MDFDEARKKVTEFVCRDCIRQANCSNPTKRMDFSADRPCPYKRKIPSVKRKGQRI